jgi:polyhydroxyalkanoate synthase subunit PhaC
MGRRTAGLSPFALGLAYTDWLTHLCFSPGKQAQLVISAARLCARFHRYAIEASLGLRCAPCIEPLGQDKRFEAESWSHLPFNLESQLFLLIERWWQEATVAVHGVSRHHERVTSFVGRQILDMLSPSNFPSTNPEVLQLTLTTNGANLRQGFANWLEDLGRMVSKRLAVGTESFRPGKEVAITPGKVIFRNHLIELIQYAPVTSKVYAEPIVIIPAWIMKYYILDLSPENSLVRFLVEKGHTVFMISWRNPGADDRDLTMQDYVDLGAATAIDIVSTITPNRQIHAVGYCLGGTLLAMTAAAMARDGDKRLKTMTIIAGQVDFTEAGSLMLFVDDAQIDFLEDLMWAEGYLDAKQMAGAFQLLRSNDLIWSRIIREYLMGDRGSLIDLMAWNADGTRLPYRMHSEYLRSLFMDNLFAEGLYKVGGKPVTVSDIRVPIFAIGTESDHVAPWRSVYKIHLLTGAEITFVLTSGGHNAGIISEPGHRNRSYRMRTRKEDGPYVGPDGFFATTPVTPGSWWPAWERWMSSHSSKRIFPPSMGSRIHQLRPIEDAPGAYVMG